MVGAMLTLVGQLALEATSKTMARAQFVERTASVSLRVEEALSQSSPLLGELERIARSANQNAEASKFSFKSPDAPWNLVALEMRDLLIGRRAVSQVYIAFADGRFLSVDPGESGNVVFQVTTRGQSGIYHVAHQELVLDEVRESQYDPRARDWYRLALAQRDKVWSAPYSFYFNRHPGVTCALPLYVDNEKTKLLAVVGVDFDVDALTHFMAIGETTDTSVHSVVFTLGGFVLAYPAGAQQLLALPKSEKVATHQALDDPYLSALIEHVQTLPERERTGETIRFGAGDTRMLASVRKVGTGGPDWYVSTFSAEDSVFSELYTHRERSLWIGTLALSLSMAVGWLLARHILRVRKLAHDARIAAARANEQIRDLGSYRLLSRLGEGGMGEVWRARHRLLAREAAIKLIKTGTDDAGRLAEQKERFRREAQAIAGLRSRNTVALFDYGVTALGTMFYVMELLDGIDLNSLVHRHGTQPAERVRKIIIQACNSLSEAHAAQLVHRDIKPANLFLCREADEVDVVKVLDFGLVFQHGTADVQGTSSDIDPQPSPNVELTSDPSGRITRPHHQLGTPAFMSPEQALGHQTDARSDLYSLACVAWWLLSGQAPFRAPNQLALMVQHIESEPGPLAPLVSQGLSTDFEHILLRCLAKSPLDRPQSARELSKALQALGPQEPGWSDEQAASWWQAELPQNSSLVPNLSLPPHHEIELLPPPKAV